MCLVCLFSCVTSDDQDPFPDVEENEEEEVALRTEISFKVDGEEISVAVVEDENNISAITGELNQNSDYTSIAIGTTIFYPEKFYAVVMYINTTIPFESIKEGDVFVGNTSNPVLLTFASLGISDFDDNTIDFLGDLKTHKNQEFQIKFTEIDHDKKLVSGTFSFDSHSTDLNVFREVRDGVFTNVLLKD